MLCNMTTHAIHTYTVLTLARGTDFFGSLMNQVMDKDVQLTSTGTF